MSMIANTSINEVQQLFLKVSKQSRFVKMRQDFYYVIRKVGSDEYLSDMKANGGCVWSCGRKEAMRFYSHKSCSIFNDIAEGIISYCKVEIR